ncbi:MAG: ribosome maturation factor RimP [Campylobacterales bacterium]|nr:ribosome maturation factor RimP [Campylobacterales bacterium]
MNLEAEIKKIVQANGATFYDTEIVTEEGHTYFRIYITREGGVDLELCAAISRELSPFLDVYPPMEGNYFMEVSSPGIERKLTKPHHFKASIGEKIKTKAFGEGKLKGTLLSADDEGFTLEDKEEQKYYKYSDVGTTKTYYEWN